MIFPATPRFKAGPSQLHLGLRGGQVHCEGAQPSCEQGAWRVLSALGEVFICEFSLENAGLAG